MIQKPHLRTFIPQLLSLGWLAGGFYLTIRACLWIRSINPYCVWFYICLLLCLVTVTGLASSILTVCYAVLKMMGKRAELAEMRLPRLNRQSGFLALLAPLPVLV